MQLFIRILLCSILTSISSTFVVLCILFFLFKDKPASSGDLSEIVMFFLVLLIPTFLFFGSLFFYLIFHYI